MKKRIFLACLIVFAIAGYFWTQSRYPALERKAASAETSRTSKLNFSERWPVDPTWPYPKRVIVTTGNWINTNRQGMTFGIVFGAAFLTLLRLLPSSRRKYGMVVNTLKGFFIGTPLGVCVNCVVPIVKAMYDSGSRLETALVTMVSSPTLNVIVLTMLFSLYPFSFAFTKLVSTLVFILLILPLLSRYVFVAEREKNQTEQLHDHAHDQEYAPVYLPETWAEAIDATMKTFLKDLWFILKTTGPLMLVAGFLGSVIIEWQPLERLVQVPATFAAMLSVAAIGTFLPAPIAFDMATVQFLQRAGLPAALSMTLLFTLGSFSVYPFLVLRRYFSPRLAVVMFAVVMGWGMLTGYAYWGYQAFITHRALAYAQAVPAAKASVDLSGCQALSDEADRYDCQYAAVMAYVYNHGQQEVCDQLELEQARKDCRYAATVHQVDRGGQIILCANLPKDQIDACLRETVPGKVFAGQQDQCQTLGILEYITACQTEAAKYVGYKQSYQDVMLASKNVQPQTPVIGRLSQQPKAVAFKDIYRQGNVRVQASALLPRAPASKPFTRQEGDELGLHVISPLQPLEYEDPFVYGKGITAGDFNNDGWVDVAFATRQGVALFENMEGKRFAPVPLDAPEAQTLDLFAVAFVDMNNDGWLDLYASSYGGTNVVILNDQHGYALAETIIIPRDDQTILTQGISFADVNHDGWLDMLEGNWSHPSFTSLDWTKSRDRLVINDRMTMQTRPLKVQPLLSATLSTLLSDVNGDGVADLFIGNDFLEPDAIFFSKDGDWQPVESAQNVITNTPFATMSYDTADINNDLRLDVFADDLGDDNDYAKPELTVSYCDAIANEHDRAACVNALQINVLVRAKNSAGCAALPDENDRRLCLAAIIRDLAKETKSEALCDEIPEVYASHRAFCRHLAGKGLQPLSKPNAQSLRQVKRNVLLVADDQGGFTESAEAYGVDHSYWSWNAKFADLDNDTWQDLYIGNGYQFYLKRLDSNVFYHNQNGTSFVPAQDAFGLNDLIHTPSYVYVDYNNDGALDIIATGVNAPIRVFTNHQTSGHAVEFEVRDQRGNRFGVGTKVIISYADGLQQMREIKAGGGFLSSDAPYAHFGLGSHDKIDRVVIQWSTGETTVLEKSFNADQRYVLTRE